MKTACTATPAGASPKSVWAFPFGCPARRRPAWAPRTLLQHMHLMQNMYANARAWLSRTASTPSRGEICSPAPSANDTGMRGQGLGRRGAPSTRAWSLANLGVPPTDYNRRMPSRVIAFFLAFVLFWSGLSTFEAPRALAQPSLEQQHAGAQPGLEDGSVEDHHLDDLPLQVQGDSAAETPGLLPAPLRPSSQSLATGQPHAFVMAAAGSPFLAGPLRPPCSEALAG